MADSSFSTNNVWPNYSKTNIDNAAKKSSTGKSSTSIDKEQFLQLLVAQLKNQDPLNPMDDKEYIAQLAQLSSVEQLSNMAADMKLLRQALGVSSDLIGKTISWEGLDSTGATTTKQGVVDSITIKDGSQYANVKGEQIALDKILKVSAPE